jgi:hypothetical protein
LIALAAATQRPANVVNLAGGYAIRVDLEYNRYVLATNTPLGLSDEIYGTGPWLVRIFQTQSSVLPDELLAEATDEWLVDAFDSVIGQLEADGKKIVADANFGDVSHSETSTQLL